MAATNIQNLLRFLTERKIPLTAAFPAVKALNEAGLSTVEAVASSNLEILRTIFPDEKNAKQILAAAKRSTKKPSKRSPDDTENTAVSPSTPSKRRRRASPVDPSLPHDWEKGLKYPTPSTDIDTISKRAVTTNRAPLLLAFAVISLGHTHPHLPLSSRFSLGQGLLDLTAGVKARSLGIAQPPTATIEAGYKKFSVLGRPIPVLRRYDLSNFTGDDEANEEAFWALSAQLLEKPPEVSRQNPSALPICLPGAAWGYLSRAYQEDELRELLGSLEVVYASWASVLSREELDRRGWGWYCRVRPEVKDGKAGWGGRGEVNLNDILSLRRIVKGEEIIEATKAEKLDHAEVSFEEPSVEVKAEQGE